MSRLTSFVLGYTFLIVLIFLICTFLQRIADCNETDPNINISSTEPSWYYWAYFTISILNAFATIVLIVGLYEYSTVLIVAWLVFHGVYSVGVIIAAIYISFTNDSSSDLIYHYTFVAICLGLLSFIYLEYRIIKKQNSLQF